MLLLLFGGGPPDPAIPIGAAVITAPVVSHGYTIDRPATSGVWRMALELGDPAAGEAFTWFDITEFYAGDSYQRGANEYLGKYAAAVAEVQLQTDNDDLAPWGQDTTPLFGVDVPLDGGLLMRLGMFRVESGVTVEWNPLWTGRVETWGDASAARGQIRTHVITVTDTIADIVNLPTTVLTGPGITTEEFLSENAHWLFGVDVYGDQVLTLAFDDTAKAAITRMDDATDAFGCVWRSLRTGRMLVYPAPWDTTNVDRWPNPLLDSYPSGLVFSYSPDFTDIAYIDDDDQTPFGIQRTSLGVLNSFTVTTPADLFLLDDPVSQARYGWRPFTATWAGAAVEQVVQDLLDARAYSSAQALPLRTSLDHEGFWSALAIVDHLDPVTIYHATNPDGGAVVTGTGVIRNVTEQRTVRGIDDGGVRLLTWQSTVQIDLDATDTSPALLPVENLALVSMNSPLLGGPSSAEFSWTNPTQPDITPTNVQLRVLGRSLIWFDTDYPGVGADGTLLGFLSAATPYTLQVRLIRRDGGVITAFSATRAINFTTPAIIVPIIIEGDDPTDTNVGIPPDFDCDTEWHIEENDGTGWTVFESGTQDDLVLGEDGLYHLPYDIANYDFDPLKLYRVCYRVDCGDGFGPWICGAPTTIPDDWTDPCTEPPALSDPPFDDPTLLVYVPKVCAPDTIREAVSGLEAVHGDALAGLLQVLGEEDRFALEAIADPEWSDTPSGILAYGECPQINGATGDKTISVLAGIADNSFCVLFECANMRITAAPGTGSNWIAGATVATVEGPMSLLSGDIAVGPDGVLVTATYDAGTGDFALSVNAVEVDSDTIGGPALTQVALPIWRVGAPPESWVTDCALWGSLVVPTVDPDDIAGLVAWFDAADAGTIAQSGGNVTQWTDKSGNGHNVVPQSTGPATGSRSLNGLNVLNFLDTPLWNVGVGPAFWYALGDSTMFIVMIADTVHGDSNLSNTVMELGTVTSFDEYGIRLEGSSFVRYFAVDSPTSIFAADSTTSPYGGWHQIRTTDTGSVASIYVDGALEGTDAYTGAALTLGLFALGGTAISGSRNLDGAIAEVLIYDHVLSGPDTAAVQAYLNDKWGL